MGIERCENFKRGIYQLFLIPGTKQLSKINKKREKDILKQEKCFKTRTDVLKQQKQLLFHPAPDFNRKIVIVASRVPSQILRGCPVPSHGKILRGCPALLMFTAWLQLDYGKILCNICLLEFTRGPNGKCFNEEFALAFIGKCYK